ncbi:hypothetical protein GF362_00610 [Candidatus Dojkabacteria bacterium]|nr:hypothetical protein [Candidatus Dojkabacteria bacterium]
MKRNIITVSFTILSILLVFWIVTESTAANPGNNCCGEADYGSCTTDGDWIDGYIACSNGQCSKCAGASWHSCNYDGNCGPGEDHVVCPNDCDQYGRSTGSSSTDNYTNSGSNQCSCADWNYNGCGRGCTFPGGKDCSGTAKANPGRVVVQWCSSVNNATCRVDPPSGCNCIVGNNSGMNIGDCGTCGNKAWRWNPEQTPPPSQPTPVPTQPTLPPPPLPGCPCVRTYTNPSESPYYNPQTKQTFPDVPISHQYFEYIQCLECDNVVHGYSNWTFKPEQPITRAEMAKIIENGFRIPENLGCTPFRDVHYGTVFYHYITTLKCWGISNGYSDGTYRPQYYITRAEAVKLIVLAARRAKADPNFLANRANHQVFYDVPTNHVHFQYINALYSNNVRDPNYSQYFRPENYITRAEMSLYVDIARRYM